MDTIRLKARAKINLGLDVVRRREDGYHEVRMVMQMLKLYDQIDIEKTETPGIRLSCNLSFLPTDERNIAYKAAKVIRSIPDQCKANIPIIAVTANAFEEDRQNAFRAGMNGHIAKPIHVEALMQILAEIIDGKPEMGGRE